MALALAFGCWRESKKQHISLMDCIKSHKYICWGFIGFFLLICVMAYSGQERREFLYSEMYACSFRDIRQAKRWGRDGIELMTVDNDKIVFFTKMSIYKFIEYTDHDYKVSKQADSDIIYLTRGQDTIRIQCLPPSPRFKVDY